VVRWVQTPRRKQFCGGLTEPEPSGFILPVRLFQQEMTMRNLLIAVCCAALMGSVSVATAQTTGPIAQDSMKAHNPMDSNAKMKKKHAKKSTKSDDSMKAGTSKEGMKKDTTK
jgi:pentapeptide MXKDX repeat protein